MKIKNRRKVYGLSLLATTGILGIVCAVALTNQNPLVFGAYGQNNEYFVRLDSSNAYSGSNQDITTSSGSWQIGFTYNNAVAKSGYHVTLNENGTLKNTNLFKSLTSFNATFDGSGTLRARFSYDGANWGGYTTLTSGETITLGSNPYYAELSATGGAVNIASAVYEYSCQENTNISVASTETVYGLVKNVDNLAIGDEVVIVGYDSTDDVYYSLQNKVKSTYYIDVASITIDGDYANVTSTNHVWTVGKSDNKFTFKNSSNYLKAYVSGTYTNAGFESSLTNNSKWNVSISNNIATMYVEDTTNVYLEYFHHTKNNAADPEFTGYKSDAKNLYIFKKDTIEHPAAPVSEVGFSATDANANSYDVNSVFANANALVVKALFDDGTDKTLTSGYTYSIVKQGSSTPIDPTEAFGESGIYVLTVNYGSYTPTVINLTVGAALTGITVDSSKLSFYTNEKLSTDLDKLSVNLTFSDSSLNVNHVSYSAFSEYNLSVSLINPNGVTASTSSVFGLDGTWTIKVESNNNSAVYGLLNITVSPVLVEQISIGSTATVAAGKTVQLTLSIQPDYADNQTVTWTSSDETVATVNESGLVTGVKKGTATITATATDGSNVHGTCALTVTAAPVVTDFEASMTEGLNASSATVNEKPAVKVGTSKKAGEMTITVGEGAESLSFYAGGWGGSDTTITLAAEGITLGSSTVTALGCSVFSGTDTAFTVENEDDYLLTVELSGVSSETTITLSASTSKRFIIWDAMYSVDSTPVTPVYPTSITLTGTSTISVGGTSQLTVGYESGVNVKKATFTSSDENVATVSSSGLVTGINVGSATITASAKSGESTYVSATLNITVSAIAVTSVSLNETTKSLEKGQSFNLVATISPEDATDKSVTWSSSDENVAIVSNGSVTAVGAGTATITATSVSNNAKKATCTVTVSEESSGGGSGGSAITDVINNAATSGYLGNTATSAWHSVFSVSLASGASYSIYSMGTTGTSNALQWNTNGYLYSTVSGGEITGVSAEMTDGKSITVYGSNSAFNSNSGGTSMGTLTGSDSLTSSAGYEYIRIAGASKGNAITSITIQYGTPEPVAATNISSLSSSTLSLAAGGTATLTPNYYPTDANTGLDVTWSSTNTNVATVTNGVVVVSQSASANQTATITASLTSDPTKSASCTLTVVEQQKAAWTIMIYLCGSDLESENSFATSDINEILSVKNQPDDVNIIIETGGSKSWHYSGTTISSSKLGRWHVNNKSLVKDDELTYSYMGNTSTFQSFLEWGLKDYPAEKTGVILWNHGGAMEGVCYDEKSSNEDTLKNSEVKTALGNALGSNKLEFIGYDACLMQVQEIAEFNSAYANYMVGSQETEAGEGWDYDTWLDDLFAKKSTETILTAIVDGFIKDNGGVSATGGYYQGTYYPADQTLSWLKLSYMSAYKTAWENMATALASKISTGGKSGFNSNVIGKTKYFADSDYARFGIFDAKHFLEVLSANSTYNPGSSYINAVTTALGNLVGYSSSQTEAAHDAHGLCFSYYCGGKDFWGNSHKNYFTSTYSSFTNWCSLVNSYGGSLTSTYSY